MIKHLTTAFLAILLVGCTSGSKSDLSEVITELSRQQKLNFKSKGGGYKGGDMIDNLFKEARNKDDALDELYDDILEVGKQANKEMAPYQTYQNIQEGYIRAIERRIKLMQDSTLIQEAKRNLKRLQAHFAKEKVAYNTLENRINYKQKYLQDLTMLMKFQVTEKLMYDHFAKKRPNPENIRGLENKLNSLQKQVRNRIKQ
ncbi:MAG TPA: hypothetical protein DCS93_16965 [Microscillaceae bacterium]|nr:hypothetical protein [Microscillaceae bacterium]